MLQIIFKKSEIKNSFLKYKFGFGVWKHFSHQIKRKTLNKLITLLQINDI